MRELEGIMQNFNFTQDLLRKTGIANSALEAIQAQQNRFQNLGAISILSEVNKKLILHDTALKRGLSGLYGLERFSQIQSKINIPSTAFDAISAISRQHEILFGNMRSIIDLYQNNLAYTQFNSLQNALSKISGQFVSIAATQKQWDLIEQFETINQSVIEITSNHSDEVGLTEEESKSLTEIIESVFLYLKSHKDLAISILFVVDIILRIASTHQYYDFLKPRPEQATTEDLAKHERYYLELIKKVEAKLIEEKEYRTTNRVCKVMSKPKKRCIIQGNLPKDFDVIVLQVNHKWVYVSYISQQDNLPQTGWVLKKYLSKPE